MADALVDRSDGIMTITMNRSERFNALTGAMLIRMYDAYREASEDDEIRCIIVTGSDGMNLDEAPAHEFTNGQALFASSDAKEGPKAFSEKQRPDFRRRYFRRR